MNDYCICEANICNELKMSSSTLHETSPSENLITCWSVPRFGVELQQRDYSKPTSCLIGQILNSNQDKAIGLFGGWYLLWWPAEDINMYRLWWRSVMYSFQSLVKLGQLSSSGGLIWALAQLFAHLQQKEKMCTHKGTLYQLKGGWPYLSIHDPLGFKSATDRRQCL